MDEATWNLIQSIQAADRGENGDDWQIPLHSEVVDLDDDDVEIIDPHEVDLNRKRPAEGKGRAGGKQPTYSHAISSSTGTFATPSQILAGEISTRPLVHEPTMSDLDQRFKLKATERTVLLRHIFSAPVSQKPHLNATPSSSTAEFSPAERFVVTTSSLEKFRVGFDKRRKARGEGTLWQLVDACAQGPGRGAVPNYVMIQTPYAGKRTLPTYGVEEVIVLDSDDDNDATSHVDISAAAPHVSSAPPPQLNETCRKRRRNNMSSPAGSTSSKDDSDDGGGSDTGGRVPSVSLPPAPLAVLEGTAGEDPPLVPWDAAVTYFQRRIRATEEQV